MTNGKEPLEKLLAYQVELASEEECLKKIIANINAQTHALQVEQLHILNMINSKTENKNKSNELTANSSQIKKEIDPASQELDLVVPNYQSCEEDEEEEMEE